MFESQRFYAITLTSHVPWCPLRLPWNLTEGDNSSSSLIGNARIIHKYSPTKYPLKDLNNTTVVTKRQANHRWSIKHYYGKVFQYHNEGGPCTVGAPLA
jgi:hypothetical protein